MKRMTRPSSRRPVPAGQDEGAITPWKFPLAAGVPTGTPHLRHGSVDASRPHGPLGFLQGKVLWLASCLTLENSSSISGPQLLCGLTEHSGMLSRPLPVGNSLTLRSRLEIPFHEGGGGAARSLSGLTLGPHACFPRNGNTDLTCPLLRA